VWFVFVGVGLALLIASGLYTRRRLAGALAQLGVRAGRIRAVRWAIAWLLFGFPILMFVTIAGSLWLGRETVPRFEGLAASVMLVVPFAWAMLVVFQSVLWLLAVDIAYLIVRRRRGIASAERVRAFAVLAVVGAFAVYTPARILAERGELRVRHHRVGATTAEAAANPANAAPFRIGFVADIQQDVHTDGERAREVYAMINASEPDIVLSGGDWINTGPDHIEAAAEAAAALQSRLGTFSVRGDHEHFAYIDRARSVAEVEQAMRRHGVAMLADEVRWFEHHGKRIAVAFLNYNYVHRADRDTIAALLARVAGADYRIAVTHQLDAALATQLEGKVDLVLGAHTHGGQVNPVLGLTHFRLARLETELIDGRYERGATTIIVTAGVGYSIVPFRYAAPGSIELIELVL
jgi:predicted MPP superfamily phosphohydrolase